MTEQPGACYLPVVNQMEDADPRVGDGFRAELFPLCDGQPAPDPDTGDRTAQRMIEFAKAFYRINLCYDRMKSGASGSGLNPEIMTELEAAVKDRDALEDRLAPEGFYAEQELDGLITVNLVFRHALAQLRPPERISQLSCSEFELDIPLPPPPGVTLNQHLHNHFAELLGIDPDDEVGLASLLAEVEHQIGASGEGDEGEPCDD